MNPLKLSANTYMCVHVCVSREKVHSFHQLLRKVCGTSDVHIGLITMKKQELLPRLLLLA